MDGKFESLNGIELEILEDIAQGKNTVEIANSVGRGIDAIKDRKKAIIKKLIATNMINAVYIACKQGVL